jgi:hypothetical protein
MRRNANNVSSLIRISVAIRVNEVVTIPSGVAGG